MRVIYGVDDTNDPKLYQVRGARYDRFYDPPVGSYAEGFEWIGEGIDWSGVSRGASLISPSFVMSAAHASPSAMEFRVDINRLTPSIRRTRSGPPSDLGNDLAIIRIGVPVPREIATYPIYTTDDPEDLVGIDLYLFGRSDAKSQFNGNTFLEQRLGRNRISSVRSSYSHPTADTTDDNALYEFRNDAADWSRADFTGPESVGDDSVVRSKEVAIVRANQDVGASDFPASYLDGNICQQPGDFFDLLVSLEGNEGNLSRRLWKSSEHSVKKRIRASKSTLPTSLSPAQRRAQAAKKRSTASGGTRRFRLNMIPVRPALR